MKGIILAGGKGTRLGDTTKVTNKHLLAVYDKPMIYYPLNTLLNGGINDITIVTESKFIPQYFQLLGVGNCSYANGKPEHRINYVVQDEADGIAGALKQVKNHYKTIDDEVAIILGDNYFENKIELNKIHKPTVFLKEVDDPNRFGVAEIYGCHIKNIEEKPINPKSNLAVTGLYVYDESIWNKLDELQKSNRGEYEITDINNLYAHTLDGLCYKLLDGYWSDMGTPDSLLNTANYIRGKR